MSPLELWGGIECTVNRVGDRWLDQLRLGGHHDRADDLDRIAGLGIRTIRYPVLWERVAPEHPERYDWSWSDARLARLRDLGIRPIVGLVHHGSGPRYTSLLDPAFPEKLGRYAAAVAERYPWVLDWTPVNEPLTTARFAALYGFWYPHATSEGAFLRALLNQLHGTVAAMRAIRAVIPGARLVQTEDMGRTFATPTLAYQADHENERRFLSLDLLCGTLAPTSEWWERVGAHGISAEELRAARCPPDVVGVNYYVTSDRVLDERLERYPDRGAGGNGRHTYVDVEAVRAWGPGLLGHARVLGLCWERYRRPLAITEAFLGCTREEQLRWLLAAWRGAEAARAEGADVRAVTAWSLLGAHDWDSLVTEQRGSYEVGAFDVRGPAPRETALAGSIRALAAGEAPAHPATLAPGWWTRPGRLLYPPVEPVEDGDPAPGDDVAGRPDEPPVLVVGARGTLGQAFVRACALRGLACVVTTREELDLSDRARIEAALARHRPWAVVNAAGYVRVDDAERDWWACYRDNTLGAALLAGACARAGIPLVSFSSDLVFDGAVARPYVETDRVGPLNVYGLTKASAEGQVARIHPGALLVRTSAFFGPWDEHNFVTGVLRTLARTETVRAADDQVVSPTYVPDLVHAALDLLLDGERGVWHLANQGVVTWCELARDVARRAGLDPMRILGVPGATLAPAPRPAYSALASERGFPMRPLDRALDQYFQTWRPAEGDSAGGEEETCGCSSRAAPDTSGAS